MEPVVMQHSLKSHKLFKFLQHKFKVFLSILLCRRLRVELALLFHFILPQPTHISCRHTLATEGERVHTLL